MPRSIAIVLSLIFATVTALPAGAAEYTEGEHYEKLQNPRPWGDGEAVEVAEIFWYGCPHCFRFEPRIRKWVEKHSDRIRFVQIPAQLNAGWKAHARAFYTARALGVLEKTHKPLFDAIHKEGRDLNSRKALRAFFIEQGVSKKAFDETWDSFGVETKLARAEELVSHYGITGVPSIVVDGQYVTGGRMAPRGELFDVIGFLVDKAAGEK